MRGARTDFTFSTSVSNSISRWLSFSTPAVSCKVSQAITISAVVCWRATVCSSKAIKNALFGRSDTGKRVALLLSSSC